MPKKSRKTRWIRIEIGLSRLLFSYMYKTNDNFIDLLARFWQTDIWKLKLRMYSKGCTCHGDWFLRLEKKTHINLEFVWCYHRSKIWKHVSLIDQKKTIPSFQQKYLRRYSHTVFIEAFLIRHQVSLVTTTSLIKPKYPVLHKLFFNWRKFEDFELIVPVTSEEHI